MNLNFGPRQWSNFTTYFRGGIRDQPHTRTLVAEDLSEYRALKDRVGETLDALGAGVEARINTINGGQRYLTIEVTDETWRLHEALIEARTPFRAVGSHTRVYLESGRGLQRWTSADEGLKLLYVPHGDLQEETARRVLAQALGKVTGALASQHQLPAVDLQALQLGTDALVAKSQLSLRFDPRDTAPARNRTGGILSTLEQEQKVLGRWRDGALYLHALGARPLKSPPK